MLGPQPGIKPVLPPVEVWRLNHWTAREVPKDLIIIFFPLCNTWQVAWELKKWGPKILFLA